MTRFLQIVLLGLAAGAAWAWSRHRQRNRDSATTASPLSVSTGTVEAKPVEPPDAVGIPVAEAETSPVTLQPDAPTSEAFVSEPEQSAPPSIVIPTKSDVQHNT